MGTQCRDTPGTGPGSPKLVLGSDHGPAAQTSFPAGKKVAVPAPYGDWQPCDIAAHSKPSIRDPRADARCTVEPSPGSLSMTCVLPSQTALNQTGRQGCLMWEVWLPLFLQPPHGRNTVPFASRSCLGSCAVCALPSPPLQSAGSSLAPAGSPETRVSPFCDFPWRLRG